MEFHVIKDEQKEVMASYLTAATYDFYMVNANMICVYAEENGQMAGYALVYANEVSEIKDLNITLCENPKAVIKGLLRFTTYTLFQSGASVVTIRLIASEGRTEVEEILNTLNFKVSEINTLNTFTLGSLKNNKEMQKNTESSDIEYLSSVPRTQKMEYDAFLRENNLFPYLNAPEINQDLSSVWFSGDKISGCFLVSTDEDGIHIEYTHTDGIAPNRLAIMRMLHKTYDAAKKIYSDDTRITAVTQNDKISEIIEALTTEPVEKDFEIEYFLNK